MLFRFFLISFFLNSCFSAVPASLLFYFPAFSDLLLFPLLCLLLVLLLCLSASPPFYFYFSAVMRFCCSASSCSSASLLPFLLVSLLFLSFALFCPVCILNQTVKKS